MKFPNIEAFPTFWENGMKLSAEHFQHLENSIEDAVRDAQATAVLVSGSFGLLPGSPLELVNSQGSTPQTVRVSLNACRAILPGGYRVELLPQNINQLKIPSVAPFAEFIPVSGIRYHIFLTLDMQKRVPAGIPQTRPIRQPYLSYNYALEAVSQDRFTAIKGQGLKANRMKIAEWQNGKIIEGYIPPTIVIQGFPLLEKWHNYFLTQLENITRISSRIVNEYRNKYVPKVEFCKPIVHHIKSRQGYFKFELPSKAPLNFASYFADLAGLIEGLMETCDRDFVRTQLRNGDIHNLRATMQYVLKASTGSPQEEIAILLSRIQQFIKALLTTLQSLLQVQGPAVAVGERN